MAKQHPKIKLCEHVVIGEDGKRGVESLYADAYLVEGNKRYPAVIIRKYISSVTVKLGGDKYQEKAVPLANLRVAYGTQSVRLDHTGQARAQPELKPVDGVALRAHNINPTCKRYYEPIDPNASEVQNFEDLEKTNTELRAELQALRAGKSAPIAPPVSVDSHDAYQALSDNDLRSHAKSVGVRYKKDDDNAAIIKAIVEKEQG